MLVTIVHVHVLPAYRDDFIRETTANHRASIQEPGNLRFDLLQDEKDPNKFVLYEAYESEAAAAAHKETAHYLHWRDAVAGWMAQPREGIRHKILAPLERRLWKVAQSM